MFSIYLLTQNIHKCSGFKNKQYILFLQLDFLHNSKSWTSLQVHKDIYIYVSDIQNLSHNHLCNTIEGVVIFLVMRYLGGQQLFFKPVKQCIDLHMFILIPIRGNHWNGMGESNVCQFKFRKVLES